MVECRLTYRLVSKAGWNSRDFNNPENLAHIDTLARSISEIGVQQPLTVVVENDSLFVTDGHCRLLATLRAIDFYGAEIRSVPVRAESRFATEADRVMGQIVRNSGKNLSPLEAGTVFVKLSGFGWSVKQIADKAGITVACVMRILDLMAGASPAIMEMVNTGKVAANMAAQVLRENDNDVEVAEEMLVDAVVIAETEGKGRATARHVLGTMRAIDICERDEIDHEAFKTIIRAAVSLNPSLTRERSRPKKIGVTLNAACERTAPSWLYANGATDLVHTRTEWPRSAAARSGVSQWTRPGSSHPKCSMIGSGRFAVSAIPSICSAAAV